MNAIRAVVEFRSSLRYVVRVAAVVDFPVRCRCKLDHNAFWSLLFRKQKETPNKTTFAESFSIGEEQPVAKSPQTVIFSNALL